MTPAPSDGASSQRGWPYTEHSRFVDRGGIRWHVQVAGSGPALLLLHGTGASSHSFRQLMPLLAERFTVIAPDLPGHAFSMVPSTFEPSLPGTAAAMSELLEEMGFDPLVAVGHSAGAAVVARMALDGPMRPALLVGIGAALVPFHGLARAVLPEAARLLSRVSKVISLQVGNTQSVERLVRSTGSSLERQGIELYRRLSERPSHIAGVLAMLASWELEGLYEELADLRSRFLLLAGASDRAVPVAQQRAVAERMPDARLVVLPRAGHLLHEESPEAVARLILIEAEQVLGGVPEAGRPVDVRRD